MTAPGKSTKRDSFFDLSSHGNVPALLRAIADRVESGEINCEQVTSSVTVDTVDLGLRLVLHQK